MLTRPKGSIDIQVDIVLKAVTRRVVAHVSHAYATLRRCTSADKQVTILLRRFSRRAVRESPWCVSLGCVAPPLSFAPSCGSYRRGNRTIRQKGRTLRAGLFRVSRCVPRCTALRCIVLYVRAYVHACSMAVAKRGACVIFSRGPTTAADES